MYKINLNVLVSCYINEKGNITSIDIKSREDKTEGYNNEIRRILTKDSYVGISYYHNQAQPVVINIPIKSVWRE